MPQVTLTDVCFENSFLLTPHPQISAIFRRRVNTSFLYDA
jgi:hypothetical protein